jgi:hypothetical protein
LAKLIDVQCVKASLASSGTIRGEPRFVPGSASIGLEVGVKVTTIGWAGSKSLSTSRPKTARGRHDASDLTTRQEIFEDGADFASHCQNMTDQAIAAQLKALADDYERPAEKASLDDATHCSIRC